MCEQPLWLLNISGSLKGWEIYIYCLTANSAMNFRAFCQTRSCGCYHVEVQNTTAVGGDSPGVYEQLNPASETAVVVRGSTGILLLLCDLEA